MTDTVLWHSSSACMYICPYVKGKNGNGISLLCMCCLIPCQVFWCCSVLSILSHQMISLLKTRSFITPTLKAFTNIVAIKQACSLICCHTDSTVLFPLFSGHYRDKIMVLVAALTLHANARYFQGLSIMVSQTHGMSHYHKDAYNTQKQQM